MRTPVPIAAENYSSSEQAILKAGIRAGLGDNIRAQVLRRSFYSLVADDPTIPPVEAASLTGHDERVWWKHYVTPPRDEQSRREVVAKLTARGLGVRPDVDQEVNQSA